MSFAWLSRARRRLVALSAAAALAGGVLAAPAAVIPLAAPAAAAPATVVSTTWEAPRVVTLQVRSAAMNATIPVTLILPRNWNVNPTLKFPTLYLLDALKAGATTSAWLTAGNATEFFANKDVLTVLPAGGPGSWYTDWQKPDNGRTYKWETFLTTELPPLLGAAWRAKPVRAIQGVSMGGAAAFMLAARKPGFYRYAGSFSGVLSLASAGMPAALTAETQSATGFNLTNMFGAPTDPAWKAHDPLTNAAKLKGTSLYFSSGTGLVGGAASDPDGERLEMLARATNQAFAVQLNKLGIAAQAVYRPSGAHTWQYWNFELTQAWGQLATALGVSNLPSCAPGGAIATAVKSLRGIGKCTTPEYSVDGGRAQDFASGDTVIWSPATGARRVSGAIGGHYLQLGGPASPLGLPTSAEKRTTDGSGRFATFEHGTIFWNPTTGAHAVRGAIATAWAQGGNELGVVGYPVADEVAVPQTAARRQAFAAGTYYWSATGGAGFVVGAIRAKYLALGGAQGPVGTPVGGEISLPGGKLTRFTGGAIYWTPRSGAVYLPAGAIADAWAKTDFERGRLGFPTSDQLPVPGGVRVTFERGAITDTNGAITIS